MMRKLDFELNYLKNYSAQKMKKKKYSNRA